MDSQALAIDGLSCRAFWYRGCFVFADDESSENVVIVPFFENELILIEFTVRGSPSTWPDLVESPCGDIAPVGSTVREYLEVLQMFNQGLSAGEPIRCLVGTEPAEPNRVILPGDQLTIVRGEIESTRIAPLRSFSWAI